MKLLNRKKTRKCLVIVGVYFPNQQTKWSVDEVFCFSVFFFSFLFLKNIHTQKITLHCFWPWHCFLGFNMGNSSKFLIMKGCDKTIEKLVIIISLFIFLILFLNRILIKKNWSRRKGSLSVTSKFVVMWSEEQKIE